MYYRRQLPHYQPDDATYFVTFRLAGSLPIQVLTGLREERDRQLRNAGSNRQRVLAAHKRHFVQFDTILHTNCESPRFLQHPKVASLVAEAIRYRDGTTYDLLCHCIMPNHVHMVFSVPRQDSVNSGLGRRDSSSYVVTDILENLKWYTALKANKILGRTGQFWQHESYDHVVRNDRELERIIAYVLANPAKAGLVKDESDWLWSYLRTDVGR